MEIFLLTIVKVLSEKVKVIFPSIVDVMFEDLSEGLCGNSRLMLHTII